MRMVANRRLLKTYCFQQAFGSP